MTSLHSPIVLARGDSAGEDVELEISCIAEGNIFWHNQSVKLAASKIYNSVYYLRYTTNKILLVLFIS